MSTQFTTDPIETLDDWNAVLAGGCCCEMPSCPLPGMESESISATYDPNSVYYNPYELPDVTGYYLTVISDWWWYDLVDGEYVNYDEVEYTWGPVRSWNLADGPCGENDLEGWPDMEAYAMAQGWMPTISADGGVDGVTATAVADPWTSAQFLSDISTHFSGYSFEALDCSPGGASTSSMGGWGVDVDDYEGFASTSLVKSRFRFVVNDLHEGTYFKFTYDLVFFPYGYDPEDSESPQPEPVETDATVEWTGPGDPEDAASWLTDWQDIPLPDAPGETRVVNIRYECYAAPYGAKPQTMGEGA